MRENDAPTQHRKLLSMRVAIPADTDTQSDTRSASFLGDFNKVREGDNDIDSQFFLQLVAHSNGALDGFRISISSIRLSTQVIDKIELLINPVQLQLQGLCSASIVDCHFSDQVFARQHRLEGFLKEQERFETAQAGDLDRFETAQTGDQSDHYEHEDIMTSLEAAQKMEIEKAKSSSKKDVAIIMCVTVGHVIGNIIADNQLSCDWSSCDWEQSVSDGPGITECRTFLELYSPARRPILTFDFHSLLQASFQEQQGYSKK